MSSPDYTADDHKSKQRFWRRIKAQPSGSDTNSLTNAQIARLAGDQEIASKLANPQYHDWFLNDKAEEDLIKAGAESAIRALLDVIIGVDEKATPTNRVTAAKILLDMAGYGAKQAKEVVFKDAEIAKMTEDELKKFIADQTEGN